MHQSAWLFYRKLGGELTVLLWSTAVDCGAREGYCFASACSSTRACASLFFPQTHPFRKPRAFFYTENFFAHLQTERLAHWHDSTHTSDRAVGSLFYIKQYGNTPTGRKMSNKNTRALPCYYAITYHPFQLLSTLSYSCARARALRIPRTAGYVKQRENTV